MMSLVKREEVLEGLEGFHVCNKQTSRQDVFIPLPSGLVDQLESYINSK